MDYALLKKKCVVRITRISVNKKQHKGLVTRISFFRSKISLCKILLRKWNKIWVAEKECLQYKIQYTNLTKPFCLIEWVQNQILYHKKTVYMYGGCVKMFFQDAEKIFFCILEEKKCPPKSIISLFWYIFTPCDPHFFAKK